MAISSVSSSLQLLETSLLQALDPSTSKAATTSSTTATAISAALTSASATSANTESDSNSVTTLTKDLTSLLKSLVTGDVDSAKTYLAKVQSDLNAQSSASSTESVSTSAASATTSTATAVTSNPLDTLVAEISKSLTSGSTTGALQDLASYLVTTGLGTGTLVNTTA